MAQGQNLRDDPLRQRRLSACSGIYLDGQSDHLLPSYGSFRANPLLGAVLPPKTAQAHRLEEFQDYVLTLSPYCLGAGIGVLFLLLVCPCCCCFASYARSRQRAPFPRTTNAGFHLVFALLTLGMAFVCLVALEEQNLADEAYARGKCAAFQVLDILVNGDLARSPSLPDFIGLKGIEDAVGASSSTFINVSKAMQDTDLFLQQSSTGGYLALVHSFRKVWHEDHTQQMAGTQFYCSLCSNASLQPFSQSSSDYINVTTTLQGMISETRDLMVQVQPALDSMSWTLGDVIALRNVCLQYGRLLDDLAAAWSSWYFKCGLALHIAIAWSLGSIALGISSLLLCKTASSLPLCAWWCTYALTAVLVVLSAFHLVSAVAIHDADGTLRAVVTDEGLASTGPALGGNLSARARAALATCLTAGGNGDLRMVLNLSLGQHHAQAAAHLVRTLQPISFMNLNTSFLDAATLTYEHSGGDLYFASWNASQTLGWQGEAHGLGVISQALRRLSLESWAFQGAPTPDECALAREFNATTDVLSTNCFYATEAHPSKEEATKRYDMLTSTQLKRLVDEFGKARAAALALRNALAFVPIGPRAAPDLRNAWQKVSRDVNAAVGLARTAVGLPMERVSGHIQKLSLGANCRAAFHVFAQGSYAVGHDYVKAQVLLSVCVSILAACSSALAALYCLLWTLRHHGVVHGFGGSQAESGHPEVGNSSEASSDGEATDEEAELHRPLRPWKDR